jgi:hypothetical protein
MNIRKSKKALVMELSEEQLYDAVAEYCFKDPRVQQIAQNSTVTFTIDWSLGKFDTDSHVCRLTVLKFDDIPDSSGA